MGVSIRPLLEGCRHPVGFEDIPGVAAIDANNALYQFLSIIRQADGTPLQDTKGRVTSHLSGILYRTAHFLENGISPLYIFDGQPPELKARTIAGRRGIRDAGEEKWAKALERGDTEGAYRAAMQSTRVDSAILESGKRLLDALGIPWVEAPSEGEAQSALFVNNGIATYSVSQDYDSLLFGASVLVRNLTVSGKRRIGGRRVTVSPERIYLSEFLDTLAITREQLIQIGILIGTDFNVGINGIGPKKALKIVRENRFNEVMAEKAPGTDPEPIMEFFLSPPAVERYQPEWRSPDPDSVRLILCDEYGFSPERILPVLERIAGPVNVKSGQMRLDAWG
ncbi:MAG: Flap endonuclease 1 [Methanomicrobiales archaeon 53_19]|uniref:flap endonuclease-1 n=1 Tax=Methanocalculus sp. TaxID=2004547 RepID=UPI00074734EF|nr:flap endonuclease-1 [Methanocalculus sp.]KUK68294.1 MAG: Flap endonuclease 1 [Methanocalculus sp. 52_23]KUL03516.1 MAG: Flap endonuclease 1 [Methanomicrobiales archaeon 53_19]HIJ06736.1 flap endonuclease-1 [Methanocalculus sp.]